MSGSVGVVRINGSIIMVPRDKDLTLNNGGPPIPVVPPSEMLGTYKFIAYEDSHTLRLKPLPAMNNPATFTLRSDAQTSSSPSSADLNITDLAGNTTFSGQSATFTLNRREQADANSWFMNVALTNDVEEDETVKEERYMLNWQLDYSNKGICYPSCHRDRNGNRWIVFGWIAGRVASVPLIASLLGRKVVNDGVEFEEEELECFLGDSDEEEGVGGGDDDEWVSSEDDVDEEDEKGKEEKK